MNDPRLPSGQGAPQPAQPLRPQPAVPLPPRPIMPGGLPKPGLPPTMPPPPQVDSEPIALIEEESAPVQGTPAASPKSKIKFGPQVASKHHDWKRQPFANGEGACRVKSFHGKYSDQGIEHMDDLINEWLDSHPGIEIKFVTSTVGVFEGKIREPALVLNLWY